MFPALYDTWQVAATAKPVMASMESGKAYNAASHRLSTLYLKETNLLQAVRVQEEAVKRKRPQLTELEGEIATATAEVDRLLDSMKSQPAVQGAQAPPFLPPGIPRNPFFEAHNHHRGAWGPSI